VSGKRLWGARLEGEPDEAVLRFMCGRDVTETPPYDEALIPYDIWVNRAHTSMLTRQDIIPGESAERILDALDGLEELAGKGEIALDPALEDVHSNIEALVTERIGIEHAGHMHTGRSRNDQVLTDMRLYMRDRAIEAGASALELAETLADRAVEHAETHMPGFTHHQHATATTFGHVMLAYGWAALRDAERIETFLARWSRCPLGSAASYGTTLPIDRELTARLLGFDGPEPNTLDSITNRWEAEADLAHALATAMTHLSSLAQTLILLGTREFRAVRLPDELSAGSSIMPQKRNPQALEAVKAHAALARSAVGTLMSLGGDNLMGYNTDQMWTKYIIMDVVSSALPSLTVMRAVVAGLTVDEERLTDLAQRDFLGSTALVEALVRDCAIPFRVAKTVVERAVATSESAGCETVTAAALRSELAAQGVEPAADASELVGAQSPEEAVSRLVHAGGAEPQTLARSCECLRSATTDARGRLDARADGIAAARKEKRGRAPC